MKIEPIYNFLPNVPNSPTQKVIFSIKTSGIIIRLNKVKIATHNCAQAGREAEKGCKLIKFSSRVTDAVAGTSGEVNVYEKKALKFAISILGGEKNRLDVPMSMGTQIELVNFVGLA